MSQYICTYIYTFLGHPVLGKYLSVYSRTKFLFCNRPFQGSYRHIAGGAKTLGRARGHQWRPYYLLVSERKLPFEILPFFSKNVYISISNSYFLDNRQDFSDMWPRFHTNRRTGSYKKRRLLRHNLTDVWAMLFVQIYK